jgi:hypothetical protein
MDGSGTGTVGAIERDFDAESTVSAKGKLWRSRRVAAVAFFLVFVLSAGYTYWCLHTGWLPEDDGTLAQAAVRVLNGQLPHRDFFENYTGGLSCIHALAFKLGGINLMSLRYCVLVFFLAWVLAVLYIATRFASPIPSAGIALLAAAWSLPQYPSAMASWYNLFFAGFGAAALLRYVEVRKSRWLFLAGVFGGASFLIKITGLYYVAAVLLFLVFREQELSSMSEDEPGGPSTLYSGFAIASLTLFLASIVLFMRHQFDQREFVHFVLPAGALVLLLIFRERTLRAHGSAARFGALFQMILPFLAGVVLPIAAFLVPYARSHSVGIFFYNVFGLVQARADSLGLIRPTPPRFVLWAAVPLLLLAVGACWKRAARPVMSFGVPLVLAAMLIDPMPFAAYYTWFTVKVLTPLIVVLGAAILFFRPSLADALTPIRRQQVLLLLALATMCSLVQFPFPAPIYFCYTAAMTALAIFAVMSTRKQPASPYILGAVMVFYLLFGVIRLQPIRVYAHWAFAEPPEVRTLNLPRAAGLKVERAELYENLTRLVQQHSRGGAMIATPECPEVYFLTGVKSAINNDQGVGPDELLRTLHLSSVNVVVINSRSNFSDWTITPQVNRELADLFPHTEKVGKYQVYWR